MNILIIYRYGLLKSPIKYSFAKNTASSKKGQFLTKIESEIK
jgi:hypothetical protein